MACMKMMCVDARVCFHMVNVRLEQIPRPSHMVALAKPKTIRRMWLNIGKPVLRSLAFPLTLSTSLRNSKRSATFYLLLSPLSISRSISPLHFCLSFHRDVPLLLSFPSRYIFPFLPFSLFMSVLRPLCLLFKSSSLSIFSLSSSYIRLSLHAHACNIA